MIVVMTGGSSPLQKKRPIPRESSDPESARAALGRANAEILQEMYRVVFVREPKDREFFGEYVDSMNQGASIEGVYNGFVHSSTYRALEQGNPGPAGEAEKFFVSELDEWQKDLPSPTYVDENSGKPLGLPVTPYFSQDDSGDAADPAPKPFDPYKAAAYFGRASVFTMKRVMGDEAIRLVDAKKSPEELARWYSKWVVRMVAKHVDFGLPLRNKSDEEFHRGWALSTPVDKLKWEVLNRIHRILNAATQVSASPAPAETKKP